jgi:hypothetical protein
MAEFPYRYGRLPAQFPGAVRDLAYYAAGPLPAAPPQCNVPAFDDWGMLGNDRFGDCGVAGLQHLFEADATLTHEPQTWPSDQEAIDYYLRYTGGQDAGVVLSAYLAYVRGHADGYYGNTVAAYAPVPVHDVPTLQTAIWLYGGAYSGIVVTDAMEQAFSAGRPWNLGAAAGHPVGGHCVPLLGYDDSFLYVCTWGTIHPISYPAWHAVAEEAWAVITGQFVAHHDDGRGISLAALQADLAKVGQ